MANESRFEVRIDKEFKEKAMEVAKSKGFAGLAGFIRFLLKEEVEKHEISQAKKTQ